MDKEQSAFLVGLFMVCVTFLMALLIARGCDRDLRLIEKGLWPAPTEMREESR